MSLSRISKLQRIAVLSGLVEKYCGREDVVENIRLAKDLANVIDELNYSQVDFSELAREFMNFFPEHWKKRTQFLLIVTKYWVDILQDLHIDNTCLFRGRGMVQLPSLPYRAPALFQKASIAVRDSIYDEIDLIIEIIKRTPEEKTSIISPNRDLSKYLALKLEAERIEYISYCDNTNSSPEFMDVIKDNFPNYSEAEWQQIACELSDVSAPDIDEIDSAKCNVAILYPAEIGEIPHNGILIYTELNETSWKPLEAGYFWLHNSLRKKLGLLQDAAYIENLFYYGIEISKKVYLLHSIKSGGQINKKSSILAKFEAIAEKKEIQIATITSEKNTPNILEAPTQTTQFALPHELYVQDVELLARAPEAFYVKKILNLKPEILDAKKYEIRNAFKAIARNYFAGNNLDDLLDKIKNSDFFAYQKALTLLDTLQEIRYNGKTNIFGSMTISMNISMDIPETGIKGTGTTEIATKLIGYADMIVEDAPYATLISFQNSPNQSTKEIIYNGNSTLLSLCLIAEEHGFTGITQPIRRIQIWNLMATEKKYFVAKELEISADILANAKNRLVELLKCYAK